MSFLQTLLRTPNYFKLFSESPYYQEVFRLDRNRMGLIIFQQFTHQFRRTVEVKSHIELVNLNEPEYYTEKFRYVMYNSSGEPQIIRKHYLLKNHIPILYKDISPLVKEWATKKETVWTNL